MEEQLTPEIIIESLRNSFFKETGLDVAYHIGKYADWLENKIVDYRLLPNLDKSSANWAKVNDKDKWFDEVRGNDIVGEEKRAEAIRFYDWLHREGYSFSDRPHRVYYGGKYYWIQDIYKKFAASTPPVKVDEGKEQVPKEWEPTDTHIKSGWKNNPKILEKVVTAINDKMYVPDESEMMEMMDIAFEWIKSKYVITTLAGYTAAQNQSSNK